MPGFTRLRLVWEPRMLSIFRIMIGLLFMEHGTAKVLDFPHQETHKIFDLLTLNPGAQGLIELIGGFLFAIGLFTPPVAFIIAGAVAARFFMGHPPLGSPGRSAASPPPPQKTPRQLPAGRPLRGKGVPAAKIHRPVRIEIAA